MSPEVKKSVILLKTLIFHYHGLDENEREILTSYAEKWSAQKELDWSITFISDDYLSAFERSKEFLGKVFKLLPEEKRLEYLKETWEDNHQKGYVTEMETTAMINLAKDWQIEKDFISVISDM